MFMSTTLLFCVIIAPALSAPDGYFTEKAPYLHQYIIIGQVRAKRQVWESTTADSGPSNIEINNREKPNEQPQNNKDEQHSVSYTYLDSTAQNYNRPPPPRHYPPRPLQRYPPQPPPPQWGGYYDRYIRPLPHDGRYPRRPGPPNPYRNEHRSPPPPHLDLYHRHRPPPPYRDERSWLPPHHRRPPPLRDHWSPPPRDHWPPPHHGPPHYGHGPPRPSPYDHGPPYHDRGPPHRGQERPPPPPYAHGPPNHRPPSPPPNGNQPPRRGQGFPPGDYRHQGQDQISSNDNIPPQRQFPYPNTFSTNEDKIPSNLNNKEAVLQNNKQDYTQLESPNPPSTVINDDKTADIIKNLKLVFSDDFRNTFLNNRQTSQNESSNNDNPTTVNIAEPQYKEGGGEPLISLEANISDSIYTTPPLVPHIFQVVPVTPES